MKVNIWDNESIMRAKGQELFVIKQTLGQEGFKKFCKKKGVDVSSANGFIRVAKGDTEGLERQRKRAREQAILVAKYRKK